MVLKYIFFLLRFTFIWSQASTIKYDVLAVQNVLLKNSASLKLTHTSPYAHISMLSVLFSSHSDMCLVENAVKTNLYCVFVKQLSKCIVLNACIQMFHIVLIGVLNNIPMLNWEWKPLLQYNIGDT